MITQLTARIRFGSLTLLFSGILTFVGLLIRGAMVNPAVDSVGYAKVVESYSLSGFVLITASILQLLGVLVLYAILNESKANRAVFVAMVLCVLGIALFLPFTGGVFVPAPTIGHLILNGNAQAVQVAQASISSPLALFLLFSSLFPYVGGYLLFGITLWRGGLMPKWIGVALAFHAPLVTIVASVSYVGELLGGFLLFIAGVGIFWSIIRK